MQARRNSEAVRHLESYGSSHRSEKRLLPQTLAVYRSCRERTQRLKMSDEPELSKRADKRTNLFVKASFSSPTASGSVVIRNISTVGCYVEGQILPALGERVRLRRGSSSATGLVTRVAEKGIGIRFERHTDVSEWLPTGSRRQQAVDTQIGQILAGQGDVERSAGADEGFGPDELNSLADTLDVLADALSEDSAVVAQYAAKLQALDVVAQKIRKLAAQMGSAR